MGAKIEVTDTGQEIEVHAMHNRVAAIHYMTVQRGYRFDRHETWGFTSGFDFYQGPKPEQRGCIRERANGWYCIFWNQKIDNATKSE
jgi:hypothetical protein